VQNLIERRKSKQNPVPLPAIDHRNLFFLKHQEIKVNVDLVGHFQLLLQLKLILKKLEVLTII